METQTGQFDPKAGVYKARACNPKEPGNVQYGESSNGNPELLILVDFPDLGRQFTVPLYFSAEAAPYSIERLRSCGWEGNNLADLTGIDKNEVQATISWEPYDGKIRMKVQLGTGGGRFNTAKPVDPATWAAKVNAITGNGGAKPAGGPSLGGSKTPF